MYASWVCDAVIGDFFATPYFWVGGAAGMAILGGVSNAVQGWLLRRELRRISVVLAERGGCHECSVNETHYHYRVKGRKNQMRNNACDTTEGTPAIGPFLRDNSTKHERGGSTMNLNCTAITKRGLPCRAKAHLHGLCSIHYRTQPEEEA